MKTCIKCKLSKAEVNFPAHRTNKDRLNGSCRTCLNAYKKKQWDKDPEKFRRYKRLSYHKNHDKNIELNRKWSLLLRYNLTLAQYSEMVAKQDGRCAICKQRTGKRLVVDHDHTSGRVRGLLCGPCNSGIGHLKDDYFIVKSAADYLSCVPA
jgi:hypothetical protein